MKFYNREDELAILSKADGLKARRSVMTMLLGRRRVGKTTLALHHHSKDPVLYFFVSKKDEALLCEEFAEEIASRLEVKIFGQIRGFEDIFGYLLELAKTRGFTLVIDEFQEFFTVNASIYSSIQKLWDLHKDTTHMHLIACGSVYSLMKTIYEDHKEPLFGRSDFKIDLQPFKPSVLREILKDHRAYTPENLLDFYMLTGGVAKYIELFTLHGSFGMEAMIDTIIEPNSLFLDEGKNRLIEEFGKEYKTYFSILALISDSKTSRSAMESILQRNISGHLARLENDYSIIHSIKPIGARPNAKLQKYGISDNFLGFWFRFIFKYRSLIEAESFERLKAIVRRDIDSFSGRYLEKLFMELLKEQQCYTQIGSYWERNNQNEIDIVAVDEIERRLLICEVKRNKKRLNRNELMLKSKNLLQTYKGYDVEYRLLSLIDIEAITQEA